MKGFSSRSLKYMCAFAEVRPGPEFVQEVLAQLQWYFPVFHSKLNGRLAASPLRAEAVVWHESLNFLSR